MNYKSVTVNRFGGPEVLQVVDNDLRQPGEREVRIKVQAAAVCRPDVTVRRGEALYSGTPWGKKPPFVPGYAVIGDIDAVGSKVNEDWATLFQLLEEGQIDPVIDARYPLLEAARANERLESGQVVGNVVLVAPELLR